MRQLIQNRFDFCLMLDEIWPVLINILFILIHMQQAFCQYDLGTSVIKPQIKIKIKLYIFMLLKFIQYRPKQNIESIFCTLQGQFQ